MEDLRLYPIFHYTSHGSGSSQYSDIPVFRHPSILTSQYSDVQVFRQTRPDATQIFLTSKWNTFGGNFLLVITDTYWHHWHIMTTLTPTNITDTYWHHSKVGPTPNELTQIENQTSKVNGKAVSNQQIQGIGEHDRTHSDNKPCKCKTHTASVVSNLTNQNQQITHTGEKPYQWEEVKASHFTKL